MHISDLEHLEVVSETKEVEGAASQLIFGLEFLSLGANNSLAAVPIARFLSTSSPGANIASGQFGIILASD